METPLRLFCFPFAGGSIWDFRGLAQRLAGRIEVCPVELPGRGRLRNEPCITHWPAVTAHVLARLRPMLAGRYAFFGYSLGALVALEVAHALAAEDAATAPVALFACAALGPRAMPPGSAMHRMDDRAMFEALRRLGGIPDELLASPELIALAAPSVRADLALYETYVPRDQPLRDVPLHAYFGRADASVGDGYRAWRDETDGRFRHRAFEGGHMFLDSAGEALAEALVADLAPAVPLTSILNPRKRQG